MVTIEGYTTDEILALPGEEIDALLLTDAPLLLQVGTARILGQCRIRSNRLVLELAQIEGGGEGVLRTLWVIAEGFARRRALDGVEWVVHAIHCAAPNLKLRRVLERRGFTIQDIPGGGKAYYYHQRIKT